MPGSRISDKILYARLKNRDKEAFIKAYDEYLDPIYRFVFFKVNSKEEAEDLTSSVFLKAWDYIQDNNLKDHKTLKSFLYKVARNAVIDHYRKESRVQNVSIQDKVALHIQDHDQDIGTKLQIASEFKEIQSKLQELKDEYREVIILKYVNELSTKEIADILDKSRGNIRVLSYRALEALRKLIDQNE